MVVNGFEIPKAYLELSEAIGRGEAPNEWELKQRVDAYGQPWEVADLRLNFRDQATLQSETESISEDFLHNERLEHCPDCADQPGFIADFNGVANFVWFGDTSCGDLYAFDFGTNLKAPSVVFWEETGYWRRVAPNFTAFIALFVDEGEAPERSEDIPPLELGDEDPSPVTCLVSDVTYYVLGSGEADLPVVFEAIEEDYAESSAAERLAAEMQVRSQLEAQGMTDEQLRRLDDVWERLPVLPGVAAEPGDGPALESRRASEVRPPRTSG